MAALNEQIKILEKEALKRGNLRAEFSGLKTVWGIGRVLGLTITYEVGDIGRFAKVGNFASYYVMKDKFDFDPDKMLH